MFADKKKVASVIMRRITHTRSRAVDSRPRNRRDGLKGSKTVRESEGQHEVLELERVNTYVMLVHRIPGSECVVFRSKYSSQSVTWILNESKHFALSFTHVTQICDIELHLSVGHEHRAYAVHRPTARCHVMLCIAADLPYLATSMPRIRGSLTVLHRVLLERVAHAYFSNCLTSCRYTAIYTHIETELQFHVKTQSFGRPEFLFWRRGRVHLPYRTKFWRSHSGRSTDKHYLADHRTLPSMN